MRCHVRLLAGQVDRNAGSHAYHQELIRRLTARGHRVSVVCFGATPDVCDCAEVYTIPRDDGVRRRVLWRLAYLFAYRHCMARLRELDLDPPDVVLAGEHLLLKGHARRFPQTPWVYLPHSLVVSEEIRSYRLPAVMSFVACRLYRHLQRWALAHADRTMRFTRHACTVLADAYGSQIRPRLWLNPMGVDLPAAAPRRAPAAEVRLLSVGRLIPSKNLTLALGALSRLAHLPWRFDIVGDGWDREAAEHRARQLGLAGRVHFHGHQRDPGPWYRRADLFLFPSQLENSPLVVLEAMSHAVPCLAVRADGAVYRHPLDELIADGRTGMLARDEADCSRKLEAALARPEVLPPLGEAARRYVAEHHTWERHLDRYEELFEELIGVRHSPAPKALAAAP